MGCLSLPRAIYMYITTQFKHLNLLGQSKSILSRDLLGRGNKSLYKMSRSHGQADPKPFNNNALVNNNEYNDLETWQGASGTQDL